jgi:hypothetical protein
VRLHGQLRVELPHVDFLPGALVVLDVAPKDVLVEADPEWELLDARLGHGRDLGLRLARTERLDGLQEE